jgi:hypothetical protein
MLAIGLYYKDHTLGMYWFGYKTILFYFLAIFVLLLVLVVYQNRSHASVYSMPMMIIKSLFLFVYVLVYCPLQPLLSCICSYHHIHGRSTNESSTSESSLDINPILMKDKIEIDSSGASDTRRSDHLEDQDSASSKYNAVIIIVKVPILMLFSPFVNYHWENVRTELQISYPSYFSSVIAGYDKFTLSHHQSHYNAILWIESVMAVFSILVVNRIIRDDYSAIEYYKTLTYSPTKSPTYSPTYVKDSPTPIPSVGPTPYPTYDYTDDYLTRTERLIDHENTLKHVLALTIGIFY